MASREATKAVEEKGGAERAAGLAVVAMEAVAGKEEERAE